MSDNEHICREPEESGHICSVVVGKGSIELESRIHRDSKKQFSHSLAS